MHLTLRDYCPEGYGVLANGNGPKLLKLLREGTVTGTVTIDLGGMIFTGVSLLEETIGALVGEIGEDNVRRHVKFLHADEYDQQLIDKVLTNATAYFKRQKEETWNTRS